MPRYPSDLSDEQWAVLESRAREVMREVTIAAGRPMVHDLRAMRDAVAYVVKNGVEWRALPADFPPWEAVYAFFERWNRRGLPRALVSWAGLTPTARQSGPRKGRGKKGHGNTYAKRIAVLAAYAAANTDMFLGERFRRLSSRPGGAAGRKPAAPWAAPSSSSCGTC